MYLKFQKINLQNWQHNLMKLKDPFTFTNQMHAECCDM